MEKWVYYKGRSPNVAGAARRDTDDIDESSGSEGLGKVPS
jgi:hypothetical protein